MVRFARPAVGRRLAPGHAKRPTADVVALPFRAPKLDAIVGRYRAHARPAVPMRRQTIGRSADRFGRNTSLVILPLVEISVTQGIFGRSRLLRRPTLGGCGILGAIRIDREGIKCPAFAERESQLRDAARRNVDERPLVIKNHAVVERIAVNRRLGDLGNGVVGHVHHFDRDGTDTIDVEIAAREFQASGNERAMIDRDEAVGPQSRLKIPPPLTR